MDKEVVDEGLQDEKVSTENLSSLGNSESLVDTYVKQTLLQEEETSKLEGWLKLSGLGFLKAGKQVWFVYGEDTGKLHYYNQPEDLLPLGEIDLRRSSLTYDASNRERPGLFEIRYGEKIYTIDAQERAHMLSWLDALQKKRRAFSIKQLEHTQDVLNRKKKHLNVSGLLGQSSADLDTASGDILNDPHPHSRNADTAKHFTASDNSESASFIATYRKWCIVNGRPTPPSSIPLMNSFNTLWHVNLNDLPCDTIEHEILSTIPECNIESNCGIPINQSDSSQTLKTYSKSFPTVDGCSSDTSLVSPSSSTATNGKLKFMSVLRNNFKVMKETVKEKTVNMSMKQSPTSQSPEGSSSTSQHCCRCRALGDELILVQKELQATQESLQTNKEIAGLLQKELDVMKAVTSSRKECEGKSEDEIGEILLLKDKYIVELEHSRTALLDENALLDQELRQKDTAVKDLKDQISMFQQTLAVKDEIIISLTNTNHDLKNSSSPDWVEIDKNSGDCFPFPNSLTSSLERKEFEILNLQDICRAYEDQNRFLTNEILELNALRQDDETREKRLEMSLAQSEAQYYQIKSKYLFLLNEVRAPVRGGEENKNQAIVNQLLQEALESENESHDDDDVCNRNFTTSEGKEYDCFGFQKYGQEDGNRLVSRAKFLQRQSVEIEYQMRDAEEEKSKKIKWENFMVGLTPHKHLVRSTDIKLLLRMGIPHQFREKIWKGCINLYVKQTRVKLGSKYYKDLEERANKNKSNPAIKQIELDLLRTLPDNKYFDKIDSPGIRKLRRVLLCYSIHNPCVGYCQGINRIAAVALLFLCEEDAFWCLVAIIEHLMPVHYYTTTLAAAQADQRVLKDLVQEKCPKLYLHLEANDVDLSFFTFNWFLAVFVDGVHPELFLRIWDVFLYEGSKILFRFALAFLRYGEDEILKQPNNLAINRYMRTLGQTITDIKRIYIIAFSELNPFPMRSITNKRQVHMQQIKLELEEFEKIRSELRLAQEAEEQRQDEQNYFSEDDQDEEQ